MNAANTIAAHRKTIIDLATQRQIAVNASEHHRTLSRRSTVRGEAIHHDLEASKLTARARRLGVRIAELEAEISSLS